MMRQGLIDAVSDASNELHLHPVDGGRWVGVVYLKDAKRIETAPLSNIDAGRSEIAKRVEGQLKNVMRAQDGGMILSEDWCRKDRC